MLRVIFSLVQPTSEIIVYYHEGSFPLTEYVLKDMDYFILCGPRGAGNVNELRVSFNIIFRFIRTFHRSIEFVRGMPLTEWIRCTLGNVIRNYQLATIEAFRPKVVVSMIDNSFDFQWMARKARCIHFMAIANSPRDLSNLTEQLPMPNYHPGSKYYFPHYFGYGPREQSLFESFGHNIKNYYSVGPLRAGYYLTEMRQPILGPIFDICLISQYEPTMMEQGALPDVTVGLKKLYEYLRTLIQSGNLTFCIATRSNDPGEIDYFFSFFGGNVFIQAYSLKNMSTYRLIDRSRLAVTLDSSAGREAFAWGRKVLFANYSGNSKRDFFAPGPWMDTSNDYEVFCGKINALLQMDDTEYLELAHSVQAQAANIRLDDPAHKVIRRAIDRALHEPCHEPPHRLTGDYA